MLLIMNHGDIAAQDLEPLEGIESIKVITVDHPTASWISAAARTAPPRVSPSATKHDRAVLAAPANTFNAVDKSLHAHSASVKVREVESIP